MTQRSDRTSGPPRKTIVAVIWFIALGGSFFVYQRLTAEPSSVVDAPPVVTPWTGTPATFIPEEEAPEPFPEEDERDVATPRIAHQPIDDPGSMCLFYKALRALETETDKNRQVRILHYGDSILTTDELSGRVRQVLQQRFGDGGHGFVLMGKPWRWYHHLGVEHGANHKWTPRPLSSAPVRDGLFGLGGVAFETSNRGAKAWAGAATDGPSGRKVASFDLSYLAQPRGGSFEVYVNDQLRETLSTSADAMAVKHHLIEVPPGASKLSVRTNGDGVVRVFGAVLESGEPGVVYDSLAINGVRTSLFDRFDAAHWSAELRRRNPSLVVFMCGANEGNNDELALGYYRTQLEAVIGAIHEAVPEAGCLIVGPLDQATRGPDGKLTSKKMPRKLTRVQKAVALENRCAFFNTYEAMGGKESMANWYRRGLGGGDFIHPTERGARKVGSWLAEALLAGYENFVFNGESCELNATTL